MELNKFEKEKIKLEELYRVEIRNSLVPSTPKGIWYYLNSSFGLWFLSTVAIGILSFSYSSVDQKIKNKALKESQIAKLDLEIESRIFQLKNITTRIQDSISHISEDNLLHNGALYSYQEQTCSEIKCIWRDFKMSPKQSLLSFHSIYEEFGDRGIISLISELSSLVETEKEKQELIGVNQVLVSNEFIPIIVDEEQSINLIESILHRIRIERWRRWWP